MNINELSKEVLFAEFEAYLKSKGVDFTYENIFDCSVNVCRSSTFDIDDVDELRVGDEIYFELSSGEHVAAVAVRDDGDSILFVFKEAYSERHCMNEDDDNSDYDDMKNFLNSIYNMFPESIKSRVVDKYNGQLLRLLTVGEVFGTADSNYEYSEYELKVGQIPYFNTPSHRTCCVNSSDEDYTCWWWLENKVKNSAAGFALASSHGDAHYTYASLVNSVRPAFSLSKVRSCKD